MTEPSQPFDYSKLSIPERILLVQEIWDSIHQSTEELPTLPGHLAELHRRVDAFERGELPPGESWEKVKAWLDAL